MCHHPTSIEHFIEYGVCETCQSQNYLKRRDAKFRYCDCGEPSSYGHYYKHGCCAPCKKIQQKIRRETLNVHDEIKTTRKTIPKTLRNQVWKKSFETLKGICPVCESNEIEAFDFHCGHMISVKNGGTDTLDNLLAICSQCNLSMGSTNMDEFKIKYFPNEQKNRTVELEETIMILNQEIINMKQMMLIMMNKQKQ